MTHQTGNYSRVAKNTLLLYLRMFLIMAVSLYTSRAILAALGVVDFGVYNVVAGVITVFGVLSGAMTGATQRYLSFELAKGDPDRLRLTFSTCVNIFLIIAALVVVVGEPVGIWFIREKLIIPPNRLTAAYWVFHFSVLTMVVMVISIPYNAAIVAHEKMSAFAYISIVDVVLRLAIVFLLYAICFDRLIVYAGLLCLTQIAIRLIYNWYCGRHFVETKYRLVWDGRLIREIAIFSAWNLWGNGAYLLYTQGVNILLNTFFGPVVNAARGVAAQVQSAILVFSGNFQVAINPQITKSYACGELGYMHGLIFRSSKFSCLMLACLGFPIFVEITPILNLWLTDVPQHTAVFVRIMICTSIFGSMANPFKIGAQATGNVKVFQAVNGGILLLIVPVAYVALRMGGEPWTVFAVHLVIEIIAGCAALCILSPMIQMPVRDYCRHVLLRCLWTVVAAVPVPVALHFLLPPFTLKWVVVGLLCGLSMLAASWLVGLTPGERQFVATKVRTRLKRAHK